jgi:hypothetical protein
VLRSVIGLVADVEQHEIGIFEMSGEPGRVDDERFARAGQDAAGHETEAKDD